MERCYKIYDAITSLLVCSKINIEYQSTYSIFTYATDEVIMGIKVGQYAILYDCPYMRLNGHWCFLRKGFWYTFEGKRVGHK